MSISLYRKYRPQNFAGVAGQKTALEIITNSIAKDRVGHAYLFSGSRGCGKTSVARIFAKSLNCLDRQDFEPCGKCSNCTAITAGESLDVIEIDGASNNGVDSIRELKENVALAPFTSKYKIYIIDEVHMLSQGAFNALLKTLEEPPEHVIFILATTEPHKVPVTIRSRCQHIPFHVISPEDIYKRLEQVCNFENIKAEPEALWEIARQADGALRDALSLLEQVTAAGDITLENVEAAFGTGSRPFFERWIKTFRASPDEAYINLKAMFDGGASGARVFEEMFAIVKDLWLASKWQKIADTLGNSAQEKNFLKDEAKNWKPEKLHYLLNVINKILTQSRQGIKNDILLGMFFMMLEAPAQIPEEISIPVRSAPPQPSTPQPVRVPEKIKANKANVIEADENLKENLLNKAHEKNFLIYCALFDARPYEQDGKLILDMEHIYNYEVLRQDRNSAAVSKIFDSYSSVAVKFGAAEYVCAKFESTEKKQTSELSADETVKAEVPENSETPGEIPRSEIPAFEKFRKELIRLHTRPEVILIKHSEQEENTAESEAAAELDKEEEKEEE
ncbi:MAG: DNA polymerase III subunit gamma/tau [Synergistaceae bacterium]|nr:DNA polymerase III subunit gamma/tau [Synergistaceae bacterium]